jgi:cytochrome d ubiquinol oxidase subunit I
MVASGFWILLLFALAFFYCARRTAEERRWLLKAILWSLPLPWLASEAGWFVAEFGRQPWSIGTVLPTFLGVSSIRAGDVALSLAGFVVFYTALLVADVYLMLKYVRLGPSSLGTGRYHLEGGGGLATSPAQRLD